MKEMTEFFSKLFQVIQVFPRVPWVPVPSHEGPKQENK